MPRKAAALGDAATPSRPDRPRQRSSPRSRPWNSRSARRGDTPPDRPRAPSAPPSRQSPRTGPADGSATSPRRPADPHRCCPHDPVPPRQSLGAQGIPPDGSAKSGSRDTRARSRSTARKIPWRQKPRGRPTRAGQSASPRRAARWHRTSPRPCLWPPDTRPLASTGACRTQGRSGWSRRRDGGHAAPALARRGAADRCGCARRYPPNFGVATVARPAAGCKPARPRRPPRCLPLGHRLFPLRAGRRRKGA